MKFGFYRVAAAVPFVKVADCKYNAERMVAMMHRAEAEGVSALCFPELSLTAYTCGDLFHQRQLLDESLEQLQYLLEASRETRFLTLFGMPLAQGNHLFNCAVFVAGGKVLGVVPKTYLPNYAEFYEKRWFAPSFARTADHVCIGKDSIPFGSDLLFRSGELLIGAEICEDLWVPVPPSSRMVLSGANLIFNLSASNEIIGKNAFVQAQILQQSARCISAYVYVSAGHGESSTDLVFAGNGYIAENGVMLASSRRFFDEEQLIVSEVDVQKLQYSRYRMNSVSEYVPSENEGLRYREISVNIPPMQGGLRFRAVDPEPFVPEGAALDVRCEEIFSIQVAGLVKRMEHTGLKKLVLGVSGGLDSTLALLVSVRSLDRLSLPRSSLVAVTMPGFGTTDRTYQNAVRLIRALGATCREIPIQEACMQHFKDIGHDPGVHDVVYENTQARERTQVLMDVANQESGLVVGTGDLSELALGWATFNGDHMSMYGVNAGVPKTLVRSLVLWVSSVFDDPAVSGILHDVADTPVSPELLPASSDGTILQKTEELVGPYVLHDFFLYHILRFGFSPEKVLYLARRGFEGRYSEEEIKKWLKKFYSRFFSQQFKRSVLPDGPKVGSVNLSPRGDWRMPSDASVNTWLDQLDKM